MPTHRLTARRHPLALAAARDAQAAPKLLLDATTVLDAPLTAHAGEDVGRVPSRLPAGRAPASPTRDVHAERAGLARGAPRRTEGDWDVAVFDAAGRVLAADASPDAQEVASGFALKGGVCTSRPAAAPATPRRCPATLEHSAIAPGAAGGREGQPAEAGRRDHPDARSRSRSCSSLDLDMTEHGGEESLGVVLHGAEDEAAAAQGRPALARRRSPTSSPRSRRRRRARAAAAGARASALPSGRSTYRTLADYNAELKELAQKNPDLVKLFTMPEKTYGGKDVLGIEITENVTRNDGKPAFFNMGVHHAREWPAGELTMEWALELVNGYKKGDARATNVVRNSRNIVVPIVNPDGFEASRTAGALAGQDGGRDESVDDTAYIVGGAATGGEYRRKNCRLPDDSAAGNCTTSVGLAENGVDPNRNYGGLWGGPGADAQPARPDLPRPRPVLRARVAQRPEVVSANQVMTLITNHTTAALVLRAPGLAALGDPVDENRGYKALGDEMAKENGYFSQKSFELYDTTGTTEDWSYNATGGFGFTFELYCGAPNYDDRRLRRPRLPPALPARGRGVGRHQPDRRPHQRPGPNKGFDGKGNREAYYIAAESALNEQRHSVLEGNVPPGTTLRLTQGVQDGDVPAGPARRHAEPIRFDDTLETVYDVGDDRHGPLARQPVDAADRGQGHRQGEPGPPSPPETRKGSPAGAADDPVNDGAAPGGDANANNPLNYNDHPITVPAGGDNEIDERARSRGPRRRATRTCGSSRTPTATAAREDGEPVVGTSQNGADQRRGGLRRARPGLQPGKKYVVRVNNFARRRAVHADDHLRAPLPFKPAQVESYTLTCERGGRVFETQQVQIDRGQVKRLDLKACAAAIQRACAAGTRSGCARSARRAGARGVALRLPPLRQAAGADRRLPGLARRPRDQRAARRRASRPARRR